MKMSSFKVCGLTTLYLILCRYCCWSQPFWGSERSLVLDSKGGYLAQPQYLLQFLFSGNIACHCWHLCYLHVLWSSGAVGSNRYFGLPPNFFQTGFVFANQASGVKEEYLFFNNKSDLNGKCDPTQTTTAEDPCPTFDLPKWLDCSEAANQKRDIYKALFEVRLAQVYK